MITNPSAPVEIFHGEEHQGLEKEESTRGGSEWDQMVAGVSSGDHGAATGGGAQWDDGTGQKREGGEDGQHRELTLEVMVRTARSEEERRRRGGARRW